MTTGNPDLYVYNSAQVHDHGQTDSLGTRVFYYELRPPSDLKGLWLTTDRDPRNQLSMKSIDLAFYGGDTLSLLLGHVPVGDHQRLLQARSLSMNDDGCVFALLDFNCN